MLVRSRKLRLLKCVSELKPCETLTSPYLSCRFHRDWILGWSRRLCDLHVFCADFADEDGCPAPRVSLRCASQRTRTGNPFWLDCPSGWGGGGRGTDAGAGQTQGEGKVGGAWIATQMLVLCRRDPGFCPHEIGLFGPFLPSLS